MEEVIHYLELKNRYFEKLLSMTEEFLSRAKQNQWASVAQFTEDRERLLDMIRTFESKIAQTFSVLNLTEEEIEYYQPRVKELFRKREWLVNRIVNLDLELIGRIDELKSERILELTQSTAELPPELAMPVASAPKIQSQN